LLFFQVIGLNFGYWPGPASQEQMGCASAAIAIHGILAQTEPIGGDFVAGLLKQFTLRRCQGLFAGFKIATTGANEIPSTAYLV